MAVAIPLEALTGLTHLGLVLMMLLPQRSTMSQHNLPQVSRRAFNLTLLGGAMAAGVARAQPKGTGGAAPAAAFPKGLGGEHKSIPLPFAAGSLKGLSERLLTSHHDNNYGGAVNNLNRVEKELAQVTAATPPFTVAALREKELLFFNSKSLHESYFGNLGGSGHRNAGVDSALAQTYGSTARWEEHWRATAQGLGGGSGWVTLVLELETGALRTVASTNHTQGLVMGVPVLVLDMYEHSYALDFGAAAPKYVDAFLENVNWEVVGRRLEGAQRASAVWRK